MSGKARLTEADVLFGLVLRALCEARAAVLRLLPGTIEFVVHGESAEVWSLTGASIERGPAEAPAARVTMATELVAAAVRGSEVDLEQAVRDGRLVFEGSSRALAILGSVLGEPKSAIALRML